jgi:type IV pilus assembly protein PilV
MPLIPDRVIRRRQRGTTLLEVLVTMLILAFGMLGLAGLQAKMHVAEMESYQRAQAIVLLSDMVERINANRDDAVNYVTGTASPLGTDGTPPASCAATAIGVARDKCEWTNALKGAAETTGTSSIGAMIGARGCIERLQIRDPSPGVCRPGVYRVTVVWQGLNPSAAPSLACASASSYGSTDALRRAIAANVTVGLMSCS